LLRRRAGESGQSKIGMRPKDVRMAFPHGPQANDPATQLRERFDWMV
jgi:hypothetical protein